MEKNNLNPVQKDNLKMQSLEACQKINKVLQEISYFGKVEIVQKLEAFNYLFSECGANPFEVRISQTQLKAIKASTRDRLFRRNNELRKAISNKESAIERQFYRNYQILNLFNKEIVNYVQLLKTEKHLNELLKVKGDIGRITDNYRNRRIFNAENFQNELEVLVDGIKKGIIVDDITTYCKLFNDFIEQEIDYLSIFSRSIKASVDEYKEAEAEVKEKTKMPELDLELPAINEEV